MIKQFEKTIKGDQYIVTYSDNANLIQNTQTGELYQIAVDPLYLNRQYTETDKTELTAQEFQELLDDLNA